MSVEEKFWSNVKIGDGCWEWNAGCGKPGYGIFQYTVKHPFKSVKHLVSSHRYSYAFWNKKSLKEIDCVLHKCDNRKCVRPDHLFEGSNLDNIKDRTKKNRGNGEKIQKITAQQCKEIQELYSTGKYRQKDLAYKFGVDQSHVSRIVNKDSSHRKGL